MFFSTVNLNLMPPHPFLLRNYSLPLSCPSRYDGSKLAHAHKLSHIDTHTCSHARTKPQTLRFRFSHIFSSLIRQRVCCPFMRRFVPRQQLLDILMNTSPLLQSPPPPSALSTAVFCTTTQGRPLPHFALTLLPHFHFAHTSHHSALAIHECQKMFGGKQKIKVIVNLGTGRPPS